jgi:hypothetical protein
MGLASLLLLPRAGDKAFAHGVGPFGLFARLRKNQRKICQLYALPTRARLLSSAGRLPIR